MSAKSSQLVPVVAPLVATAVAALAVDSGVLLFSVPGGIALGAVLPGLVAVRAIFVGRALRALDRITLIPVLSLAVLVLGGLLMAVLRIPLNTTSWLGLTGLSVLAFTGAGFLRRSRQSPTPASVSADPGKADSDEVDDSGEAGAESAGTVSFGYFARRLAPLAIAVVLLVGAGFVSVITAKHDSAGSTFTALSLVPAGAGAPNSTTRSVVVVVTCHEARSTVYRVRLAGPTNFTAGYDVTLAPGREWVQTLDVPTTGKVTAILYRQPDTTTPYRSVWLAGTTDPADVPNAPPPNAGAGG